MEYDIIIKNTNIIDGTGRDEFKGDIGINNERIIALGDISGKAKKEIDGSGLITCPGFIDIHSHVDTTIYKYPEAFNLIMQGITTFVGGNCGFSLAPFKNAEQAKIMKNTFAIDYPLEWESFGEWLNAITEKGLAVNYVPLVGYSTVRDAVMGADNKREATPEELKEITSLVVEAFESGAFGVSFILDPGSSAFHSSRHELIEVVKIAKKYNGYFTPHTRHHQNQWPVDKIEDEGYGLFYGYKGEIITGRYHGLLEAIEISRSAGNTRLHISHLTPAYIIPQPHPETLDVAIAIATLEDIIDKAKREGIDISYNVLPSEYSIGSEAYIINEFMNKPYWKNNFSKEEFISKLGDKNFKKSISDTIISGEFKFGMINPVTDPYWFDCYRITKCKNKKYEGKVLGEIIREKYYNNIINMVYNESLNLLFDILIKDKREYGVLEEFLRHPLGIPGSDTLLSLPPNINMDIPKSFYGISPLFYGMFIHFLRIMVKEKKVLSLKEAIMKITSFPAKKVLIITDRGVIKKGAYADIVMMDFDKLRENEDFRKPHKTPEGIKNVFVNGKIVCENGTYIGKKAGKVLRKK